MAEILRSDGRRQLAAPPLARALAAISITGCAEEGAPANGADYVLSAP